LLGADQLTRRSVGGAVQVIDQSDLLVARDQARVQHVQRGQVAEVEGAVDLERVGRVRLSRRQPLVVGLHGGSAPRRVAALGRLVVVSGAARPGVVGQVVVVSPIIATSPLWIVLGSWLFLRDIERLTVRTVLGAACVVAGTIAISVVR